MNYKRGVYMLQTVLVKTILENAEDIKKEFGCEFLCASHVAVAVADFCSNKYIGFSVSDFNLPRFEEERLRYIFSKEVKLTSYFRIRLKNNVKSGVPEDRFDIAHCECIAESRGAGVLSADIVFLCALQELHPSYKPVLKSISTDESVIALLQDVDKNIYDYVVNSIDKICSELKKKSCEAAAIRDWKPAEKFAEPRELSEMFFEKIGKTRKNNVLTLNFPKFFGDTDLKVSIHKADGIYYVNDNGRAIKHLAKRLDDGKKLERAIPKVCAPCWIYKGRITGCFSNAYQFIYYLKMLVFVAHGDLYYTKADQPLYYKEKSYVYVDTDRAEAFDEAELLNELKSGINFCYDENSGLYCWLEAKYSLFSGRAAFLMETLEKGNIRISDKKKGRIEGEIFEAFYWDNDDIATYHKFITKITERFGAEFDGRNVYLTDKAKDFHKSIFKFFNLAVLLSEFGHDIALPKIRKKG